MRQWDSAEHFNAGHDEGFRELAALPHWKEFPALPLLVEVVHQNHV
jgi:hypothetical protein